MIGLIYRHQNTVGYIQNKYDGVGNVENGDNLIYFRFVLRTYGSRLVPINSGLNIPVRKGYGC